MNQRLADQVAELERKHDELIRARAKQLPEAVAREIYQRGYRSGYSAGRRLATTRGPYRKTRQIIGPDPVSDKLTLEGNHA